MGKSGYGLTEQTWFPRSFVKFILVVLLQRHFITPTTGLDIVWHVILPRTLGEFLNSPEGKRSVINCLQRDQLTPVDDQDNTVLKFPMVGSETGVQDRHVAVCQFLKKKLDSIEFIFGLLIAKEDGKYIVYDRLSIHSPANQFYLRLVHSAYFGYRPEYNVQCREVDQVEKQLSIAKWMRDTYPYAMAMITGQIEFENIDEHSKPKDKSAIEISIFKFAHKNVREGTVCLDYFGYISKPAAMTPNFEIHSDSPYIKTLEEFSRLSPTREFNGVLERTACPQFSAELKFRLMEIGIQWSGEQFAKVFTGDNALGGMSKLSIWEIQGNALFSSQGYPPLRLDNKNPAAEPSRLHSIAYFMATSMVIEEKTIWHLGNFHTSKMKAKAEGDKFHSSFQVRSAAPEDTKFIFEFVQKKIEKLLEAKLSKKRMKQSSKANTQNLVGSLATGVASLQNSASLNLQPVTELQNLEFAFYKMENKIEERISMFKLQGSVTHSGHALKYVALSFDGNADEPTGVRFLRDLQFPFTTTFERLRRELQLGKLCDDSLIIWMPYPNKSYDLPGLNAEKDGLLLEAAIRSTLNIPENENFELKILEQGYRHRSSSLSKKEKASHTYLLCELKLSWISAQQSYIHIELIDGVNKGCPYYHVGRRAFSESCQAKDDAENMSIGAESQSDVKYMRADDSIWLNKQGKKQLLLEHIDKMAKAFPRYAPFQGADIELLGLRISTKREIVFIMKTKDAENYGYIAVRMKLSIECVVEEILFGNIHEGPNDAIREFETKKRSSTRINRIKTLEKLGGIFIDYFVP